MKSCCFTGHRDLPREAVTAIQGPLARQIEAFIAEGIVHFYAGGALGFDFLVEQAVLKAREQYPQIRLRRMPTKFYTFRITIFAAVCKREIDIWSTTAMFAFPTWFTQKVEQNIR